MATRREALAGVSAAAFALPALGKTIGTPGLDALARRSGRRFGSAVAWGPPGADRASFANPEYDRIMRRDCSVVVAENELKWQSIRPSVDRYDFGRMDQIAAGAAARGMAVRGHTLFWVPEKWYPQWLLGLRSQMGAAMAERLLTGHVRTVCGRYGRRILSYDVVNEAIQPETGAIRDTPVTRALGGEAMLDLLFHTARAEAPHAELVYNDYMSWERTAEDPTHMAGVLRLLEGFRKRGTPVHTLGIQSHIRLLKDDSVAAIVRESERPWRAFLDEVVGMGYRLAITEFDVNDRAAPSAAAMRDRRVAEYARAYLELMLSYPQLGDVLAWGMSDRYSWLTDFEPRRDGLRKRGTPYDARFSAKPLRGAIASALRTAVPRTT